MIDEDGLLVSFVEESQQHLQNIEPDLLELEQGGDVVDAEVLNRIFRSIHSIKGASGFFGLQKISELSHIMENFFSLLRDGKLTITPEMTDALLAGVDALRAMVDDVTASEEYDISQELDTLQTMYAEIGTPSKKVSVSSKTKETAPEKNVLTFEVPEEELEALITSGKYLYSVKIYLHEDLKNKEKTPYDYINSIESLGQFVDSFLDIHTIAGLENCLDNQLAFHFIFSTVLDPDLISVGLELPDDRITTFNLDAYKKDHSSVVVGSDEHPEESPDAPVDTSHGDTANADGEGTDSAPGEEAQEPSKQPAPKDDDAKTASKTRQIQTEEKLRVGVSLLNELVNLAGELVLGRNQLMEISTPLLKDTPELNVVLQHVSRVTTELQEKIMQLRMQPVSVIFGKFHRVVRDLSKNLGKEITLETHGEDVEMEKSIIESLSDPLTHIIRNSADHGIETPEVREKKGKSRQGTIVLKAYHDSGQVHLEINDNGAGIDPQRVGQKAVEKGLITQEQMDSMNDRELVNMVMQPGFSTAEKVSSVSGRGVGMDVVRTNIEHLGGKVEIDSTMDEGTTIKLILPLTLAIVTGLVTKIWDQTFILPEVNIDEIVGIEAKEIEERIDEVQNAMILRLRDILVPLINLKDILDEGHAEKTDRATLLDRGTSLSILILKYGSSRLGLIVDAVENMEEIVVKPLPSYLKKMKCYSGATILGNGQVALILDIGGIVEKADLNNLQETVDEQAVEEDTAVEDDVQTFLVFDEGTDERFAIPLELITRIERVPVSAVEHIRDKEFFQYQGENLRLIYLEDFLPISRPDRKNTDKLGVIIPRNMRYPMGIVINQVIDTISTTIDLDTTTVMADGLFGSAVIDGKITLLIDMYRLFEMAAPEWYDVGETAPKKKKDRPKKVLLVEDTPFFRMVETEYLESRGFRVTAAEDGRKALRLLDRETFDAVILDILMPVMDGWETIRAIRADDRFTDLPVIAVTSLGEEETMERGLREGFNDWEVKLNKTSLIEKLNALLVKAESEARS